MPFRLLFALVALALVPAVDQRSAQPERPNVVLIVADDLGYGDLGSYGAPDIRTPNLDRLARDGVRLTQFYANASVCTPTRAALLTGRYQQRVLLERPLETNAATPGTGLDIGLAATGRSLPQLLKNAGYATGLIGKWHLGFKPEFQPNRHGFDYFWGFLAGYVDWYTHVRGDGQADLWENQTAIRHDGYLGHALTNRAVGFISEHANRPFFLEVTYGAPHWPFQSPHRVSTAARRNDSMVQWPADANPPSRKDYAEIVEDLDSGIGRILDAVQTRGLAEKTLVIFTSDNGGEWLSRNAPFFHRKDTVWEGGIRVPAIFRWTGTIPAGRTPSQVGITMDLSATILALAGGSTSESGFEGIDLLPILQGRAPAIDRTLFWRVRKATGQQRAVRSGHWKMMIDGATQLLFDLSRDSGERDDLAARHPDRVRILKGMIEAWEKDVDAAAAAVSPVLRQEAATQLAFVGARIIDGTGAAPIADGVMVVQDGKIAAIGAAASVKIPAGATRVNVSGKTIMPGMINAHGHVGNVRGLSASPEFYTPEHVRHQLGVYARYGVTTVFSLGGDGPVGVQVRDEKPAGVARLFVAGPVIAQADPEAARRAVDGVKAMKADLVKIRVDDNLGAGQKMPAEAYRAAIARAHTQGLTVAAHIFYLKDATDVLSAGADLIAHSVRDAPVDRAFIDELKARGACVCPALMRDVATFVYESRPSFFDDPFFRREADLETMTGLQTPQHQAANRSPSAVRYKAALEVAKANLKRLQDAGVRIAMGTDTGPVGRFQGYFEHLELEQMVAAGLTPMQAIVAATSDAARCMHVADRIGTLRPGLEADFLVLARNPLDDIRHTRSLESSWVGGNRVGR